MKKIYLIWFVALFAMFNLLNALYSDEILSPIENDLNHLMLKFYKADDSDNVDYLTFFNTIIAKYKGEEWRAINTVHLKYLFLTRNKEEFFNLLEKYPQNYIFKPYLEVNGRKIDFLGSLNNTKAFAKNDLKKIWFTRETIENNLLLMMKKNDYSKLATFLKKKNDPYNILESGGEMYWVGPSYCVREDEETIRCNMVYPDYEISVFEYLINNFSKYGTDDGLVKLLDHLIGEGTDKYPFIKKFDAGIYTADEISEIYKVLTEFQNKKLNLNSIVNLNHDTYGDPKAKNFKYISQDYTESIFHSLPVESVELIQKMPVDKLDLLSINNKYFLLHLGSVNNPNTTTHHYLLFKKHKKNKWIPFIRYKSFGYPKDISTNVDAI